MCVRKLVLKFLRTHPWWTWSLRHAAWAYNRFHVRGHTRTTPYSKIRLKNICSTCVTVWRVDSGTEARSTLAEKPDSICFQLLVGQGLAHRRTHRWEQGWGFPHANGQETDRGQELVGGSCRTHGMDTVENCGKPRGAGHQRLLLERGTNPSGTHHCQLCPAPTGNRHRDLVRRKRELTRYWRPRARRINQIYTRGRVPRPEEERAAKQPRVTDTSPLGPVRIDIIHRRGILDTCRPM